MKSMRQWCSQSGTRLLQTVSQSNKLPGYRELGPCFSRGWDAGPRLGDSADLKRRWRVASCVMLLDSRGGGAARKHTDPRHSVSEPGPRFNANTDEATAIAPPGETGAGILLAEPARPDPEPESFCARCLRKLPRSIRVKIDATFELN